MSTSKPRLTVTFDPELHAIIKRLAELQGVSMSYVVNDFLCAMKEPLSRTVALMDAARDAPDVVKAGLVAAVSSLESDLVSLSGATLVRMDAILDRADPRGSNTGVRSSIGSQGGKKDAV